MRSRVERETARVTATAPLGSLVSTASVRIYVGVCDVQLGSLAELFKENQFVPVRADLPELVTHPSQFVSKTLAVQTGCYAAVTSAKILAGRTHVDWDKFVMYRTM